MTSSPYQKIGLYHLLEKIAEGGFSQIFLAIRDGQPYAIKRLKSEKTQDPQVVSDFVREVRIASSLEHPNILKILDQGKTKDVYFSVTEPLLGLTIGQLIDHFRAKRSSVPLSLSLYLIRECCQALRYLHHTTIFEYSNSFLFHGDLAPDNLILMMDGTLKLLDFGSAGQESLGASSKRHFGKLFYLPPEVLRGEPPNKMTDVYALTVLAFFLLFGQHPFEAKNKAELIEGIAHLEHPRLDLKNLVRSMHDEAAVRIFFNKGLHKDQKLRFQNIEEYEHDFFRIHFLSKQLKDHMEVRKFLQEHVGGQLKELDLSWSQKIQNFYKAYELQTEEVKQDVEVVESLLGEEERRKYPRILTREHAIQAEILDSHSRAKIQNKVYQLSKGGILIKWESLIPRQGGLYPISIYLGKDFPPITTTAKLLYEISIQGRSHVGLEFVKISEIDLKILERYVEKHAKDIQTGKVTSKPHQKVIVDALFSDLAQFEQEFENNIKHGGLFLKHSKLLENGESVWVRVRFSHTLQNILLKGKVVFCKSVAENKHEVSLQLDLSPGHLGTLLEISKMV